MYVNKCTKCGAEFETKNPKRVICPGCLYPDKKVDGNEDLVAETNDEAKMYPRSYSAGSGDNNSYRHQYQQGQGNYRSNRMQNNDGGYRQSSGGRSYQNGGNYNRRFNNNNGSNKPYNSGYGGRSPQQGRFNNRSFGRNNNFSKRPNKRAAIQKQLLVSKEQLAQIEELYKKVLPLPNADIHEVIGQAIGLEPRKVFFGINLIRQKMFLPKLPFPKRKLAVTPEQVSAIKMLYEPLLPLPPIGCHKIIAIQLKMDEWRVHVGISVVRRQMGLERWNEGRPDAPPKKASVEETVEVKNGVLQEEIVEEKKVKRTRKSKKVDEPAVEAAEKESVAEVVANSVEVSTPKKCSRKKKAESDSENS